MDATTIVALFAFAGTVVMAISGTIVAILTNKSEKKQTAYSTLEKAWEQRVLLRDETILELKEDIEKLVQSRDKYRDIADQLRREPGQANDE